MEIGITKEKLKVCEPNIHMVTGSIGDIEREEEALENRVDSEDSKE
jgi:hypothetical protein